MTIFKPSLATRCSPDTLLDLCIWYCTQNLAVLACTSGQRNDGDDNGTENRTCQLPLSVGNRLLDHYLKCCVPTAESQPHVDALFNNRGLCSTVDISRMHMVSDRNLVGLSHNHIKDLSIIGCEGITKSSESDGGKDAWAARDVLSDCSVGEGLKELFVRNRQNLESLKVNLLELGFDVKHLLYQDDNFGLADMNMDNFYFPNMKTLTVQATELAQLNDMQWLACMVQSNRQLTMCNFTFPVRMEEQLYQHLPNLVYLHSLVLSHTDGQPHSQHDTSFFTSLARLKHLRHLDLSSYGNMKYTDSVIAEFIHFLEVSTQLCSLDICGTNLTYIVRHEPHVDEECRGTCMPDFPGRQFEYLGLGVSPECRHKCIPARKMFKGLLAYVEKLLDWPTEGFDKLEIISSLLHCLRSLLHEYNWANIINYLLTVTARRKFLELILVVISNTVRDVGVDQADKLHKATELNTVRCYMFEQYIRILCSVVDSVVPVDTKVMALGQLHTACRASHDLKAVIGDRMGTTQLLINIINGRVRVGKNYDVMFERLWSVLWTLTDEVVPGNCEAFIRHNGMEVGLRCIQQYPEQPDLYRKISGVMRNVSECPNLRPQLMTSEMIAMFRSMLRLHTNKWSPVGDIDICYNAVAFLVLLLAEGVGAWTVDDPQRDTVVKEVEHAIDGWDILQARRVRFRSLTPMLIQFENFSEPVAQYWGIWLICNIVKFRPKRYVPMFQEQRGEDVLHRVQTHPALTSKTRDLITTILDDVALYDGNPEEDVE